MLVREVMTSPAVTLGPDDDIRRAARVLLEHQIASAPVVDEHGGLVGFASEADLVRGRTEPDPRAHLIPVAHGAGAPPTTVAGVMSHPVRTVTAGQDVAEAARLLLDHGVRALPVVEGGTVVGIVARRDLLRSFARDDEDVLRDVVQLLRDLGLGEHWTVGVRDGVVELRETVAGATAHDDARRQRVATVLARTVPGVVRVRPADESTP